MPPVEGLNEQNARSQIEAAGLVVSVSEQDVSNPGQDGRVLIQSPVANQQVEPGRHGHHRRRPPRGARPGRRLTTRRRFAGFAGVHIG